MTVRIYELARDLGVESKALLDWLRERGVAGARSASSVLPASTVAMTRESFREACRDLPRTLTGATREDLRQGWVGQITLLGGASGVERPAPRDGVVHACTVMIPSLSLCGRTLPMTFDRRWPPKPGGNEPCPMCWHGAEKLPEAKRANHPFR